uniref:Uncharacterized protein n=1 Tax=Avena sativa TaxID=4498 RepID=A0ACD5XNW0_AVESA
MSLPKRKNHQEDEVAVDVASESTKTMHLVLQHGVKEPAYSVFKVDAAAAGCRRARHLIRLRASRQGMSFVAVHSKPGSWIVGVGGVERPSTIIYDPSTHEEFQGPRPKSAGIDPVLISRSGKIYSISRRPFFKVNLDVVYVSWFQCLSFKKGPGVSFWEDLDPPPFFPARLTPRQWLNPPDICVLSYAAVGSYILLSPEHQPGGTFAYHIREETWTKIHEKNLPFLGDAVPLGGHYFASRSKSSSAMAVFYLAVDESSVPARLSVMEFTVPSEDRIPGQLLCPLGGTSFCAIDLKCSSPSSQSGMLKTAQIILTTCQMNINLTHSEAQVIVKEHRPIYRFRDQARCLASPMPVVAALHM